MNGAGARVSAALQQQQQRHQDEGLSPIISVENQSRRFSTQSCTPADIEAAFQVSLGDVFDVATELLRQHEVRMCLKFLEALVTVNDFSKISMESGVVHVMNDFVDAQRRKPDTTALKTIDRGLQGRLGQARRRGNSVNNSTSVKASSTSIAESKNSSSTTGLSWSAGASNLGNGGIDSQAPKVKINDETRSFGLTMSEKVGGRSGSSPGSCRVQDGAKVTTDGADSDSSLGSDDLVSRDVSPEEMEKLNGHDESKATLAIPSGKWIIHPSSHYRLSWDCLGLIFIVAESILVPLNLGFDVELSDVWLWITTAFFGLDMLSQFSLGYYKNGILIMQQKLIVKNYLTSYFIIDLCATLPWEQILTGTSDTSSGAAMARIARAGKMLRMMRLLRVVKLRDMMERLEDTIQSNGVALILSLCKILLLFIVLCHWSACLWGVIGNPDKVIVGDANPTSPHELESCEPGGPCEHGIVGSPWLRRYGLDRYNTATNYLIALQYSMGLLTGTDTNLSPGFWGERVFVVVMMVVSFLLCSVVLSQIVVVVGELNQAKMELKTRIRQAKEFMASRKVPQALQAKVKRYLIYEQKASTNNTGHNLHFMSKLSPWIRLELNEHMNRDVILRHPFFKELPRPVLQRVCASANTVLCAPEDTVVQKGHQATSMVYIVKGTLKVLRPAKKSKYAESDRRNALENTPVYVGSPSWIGDVCLFKDMIRANTVISVSHAELLTIMKETLVHIMAEFPKAQKHYDEYRRRILEGDLEAAGVVCKHCNSPGHFVGDCPKLQQQGEEAAKETQGEGAKHKGALKKLYGAGKTFYKDKKKKKHRKETKDEDEMNHVPSREEDRWFPDAEDSQEVFSDVTSEEDNSPGGIHVEGQGIQDEIERRQSHRDEDLRVGRPNSTAEEDALPQQKLQGVVPCPEEAVDMSNSRSNATKRSSVL